MLTGPDPCKLLRLGNSSRIDMRIGKRRVKALLPTAPAPQRISPSACASLSVASCESAMPFTKSCGLVVRISSTERISWRSVMPLKTRANPIHKALVSASALLVRVFAINQAASAMRSPALCSGVMMFFHTSRVALGPSAVAVIRRSPALAASVRLATARASERLAIARPASDAANASGVNLSSPIAGDKTLVMSNTMP